MWDAGRGMCGECTVAAIAHYATPFIVRYAVHDSTHLIADHVTHAIVHCTTRHGYSRYSILG